MPERMSLDKLNSLFEEALRRHVAKGGLVGRPHEDATMAAQLWWHQNVVEPRLEAELRRTEDARLAAVPVEELLAEWDDDLPRLQGEDKRLIEAGWGRQTMKSPLHRGRLIAATPTDQMQPHFTHQCYQCGLPITNARNSWSWKDHGGNTTCPLTFVDPVDIATESHWIEHQPMPWEPENDDEEEDE